MASDEIDLRDEDRLPWLETVEPDEPEGPGFLRVALLVLLGLVAVGAVAFGIYSVQQRTPTGEGELIAWRSIPGSDLDTAGSVQFQPAPGDRGSILKISMKYDPPGGKAGATLASLVGAGFEQTLHEDLRRLKQRLEAGEVATVAGQPRGTCRPLVHSASMFSSAAIVRTASLAMPAPASFC